MRTYGVVHTAFWSDDRIMGLSDRGKLLAMYWLTGPHTNALGCFRCPTAYICGDLGWSEKAVNETVSELLAIGFANRCGTTGWTFVSRYLKHNPPANPNVFRSLIKMMAAVPSAVPFRFKVVEVLEAHRKRFAKWFPEPLAQGMANQDQDQDQIQDQEESPPPPLPAVPKPRAAPASGSGEPEEFVRFYERYPRHEARADACKAWRQVTTGPDRTDPATIEAGLSRALRHWKANGTTGKYLPLPASWLRGRRWTDDLSAPPAPPNGRSDDHGRIIPTSSRNPDIAKASREGRDLYEEAMRESPNWRGHGEVGRG